MISTLVSTASAVAPSLQMLGTVVAVVAAVVLVKAFGLLDRRASGEFTPATSAQNAAMKKG